MKKSQALLTKAPQMVRKRKRARKPNGAVATKRKIGAFVAYRRDITARKAAEAALRQSEERYRTLVEAQADLICRFQPDFRLTFVNQAYSAMLGKRPDEVIGQKIFDFIPVEYHAGISAHLATLTPARPSASYENPALLPDGSLRWFQWTDRLITDETGRIREYQAVGRDVTERRLAEAAEREQRRLAEALRDSLVALTSSLAVEQVMQQILLAAATVVPSEAGSIMLFEGDQGRVAYVRGFPPGAELFFKDYRFPIAPTAHGEVLVEKQPYFVADTQASSDWLPVPFTEWIRSSIGIPIKLYGEIIGLLVVDSAIPHHFCAADIEKLSAFAHYASLALEKAEYVSKLEARVIERTTELHAAKARVEAILHHSPDGILLVHPDLSIQQTNVAFETLFGYTSYACCGQSLRQLLDPDDLWQVNDAIQTVLRAQVGQQIEVRARRCDGMIFKAELSIGPIRDGSLVCTWRDITARKRAAEILREQRDFLQRVIDSVPQLISVKDGAGRFEMVNTRAAQVYGITPADMVGKLDSELNANQAEVAFFRQKDRETIEGGQTVFIPEQPILGRYYQTSKIPLQNGAGVTDRLLLVSSDITERKQTEVALQQALQREKELGELKARFVSMASHEFRTPLAAIRATAETLTAYRRKLSEDQIEKRLSNIQQQVDYLKGIIEDVLQLTRLQARRIEFNPAPLNLDELCRNILDELRSQFAQTGQLIYTGDATLCNVHLDKKLMRQIIDNLVANALKYSPTDKTVHVTLASHAETIVLTVQDQGIGIPEADQAHLFEPFHRAANVGAISGTGLGLTITKESVEIHGGAITVESQVGVGTTVSVRIPVTSNGAP